MNDTAQLPPHDPGAPHGPSSPGRIVSALRFWERRRPAYNLVLTGLVVGWIVMTWPHFRPAFNLPSLTKMLVLAALANICYCAAYPVDFALQLSPIPEFLRRSRAMLWWAGMLFAFALAWYWIGDEIYPDFR